VNRKAGMMVLFTLVFIFVWQPRLSMYSVEEALTVMLGMAILLTLLLLPVIAFLLLWHGARFVFLLLKGVFDFIVSVRDRPRVLHGR
jgi:hypothetical protein